MDPQKKKKLKKKEDFYIKITHFYINEKEKKKKQNGIKKKSYLKIYEIFPSVLSQKTADSSIYNVCADSRTYWQQP
jgi:hypothetical protein